MFVAHTHPLYLTNSEVQLLNEGKARLIDGEVVPLEEYKRNPVNSQGLRYVSEEVGYVDQDEEYY